MSPAPAPLPSKSVTVSPLAWPRLKHEGVVSASAVERFGTGAPGQDDAGRAASTVSLRREPTAFSIEERVSVLTPSAATPPARLMSTRSRRGRIRHRVGAEAPKICPGCRRRRRAGCRVAADDGVAEGRADGVLDRGQRIADDAVRRRLAARLISTPRCEKTYDTVSVPPPPLISFAPALLTLVPSNREPIAFSIEESVSMKIPSAADLAGEIDQPAAGRGSRRTPCRSRPRRGSGPSPRRRRRGHCQAVHDDRIVEGANRWRSRSRRSVSVMMPSAAAPPARLISWPFGPRGRVGHRVDCRRRFVRPSMRRSSRFVAARR